MYIITINHFKIFLTKFSFQLLLLHRLVILKMMKKARIPTTQESLEYIYNVFVTKYLPNIMKAGIIFIIGYFIANFFKRMIAKHMSRTNPVAQNFVSNVVYFAIMIPVVIVCITKMGVHSSSIVAIVGSAGLAIGLAFQTSLSNISSGMMIVLFRPFKNNDFVELDAITGNVKQIGLFSTSLLKADNTTIIIPNSRVMSSRIINYSDQKIRRVDVDIVIDFNQNINELKKIVMDMLLADNRIISYPAPAIIVQSYRDWGMVISIRPWTSYATYWEVLYDFQELTIKLCQENNIKIARPMVGGAG